MADLSYDVIQKHQLLPPQPTGEPQPFQDANKFVDAALDYAQRSAGKSSAGTDLIEKACNFLREFSPHPGHAQMYWSDKDIRDGETPKEFLLFVSHVRASQEQERLANLEAMAQPGWSGLRARWRLSRFIYHPNMLPPSSVIPVFSEQPLLRPEYAPGAAGVFWTKFTSAVKARNGKQLRQALQNLLPGFLRREPWVAMLYAHETMQGAKQQAAVANLRETLQQGFACLNREPEFHHLLNVKGMQGEADSATETDPAIAAAIRACDVIFPTTSRKYEPLEPRVFDPETGESYRVLPVGLPYRTTDADKVWQPNAKTDRRANRPAVRVQDPGCRS